MTEIVLRTNNAHTASKLFRLLAREFPNLEIEKPRPAATAAKRMSEFEVLAKVNARRKGEINADARRDVSRP